MCPKFDTNPIFKYTKCHISTNLLNFLKLCLLYCQKLFAIAPTNLRFAEKNRVSVNTGTQYLYFATISDIVFQENYINKLEVVCCANHEKEDKLPGRRAALPTAAGRVFVPFQQNFFYI